MSGPIDTIARRGERTVVAATVVADALLRATVVKIVAAALDEIDLTRLIRENVDIDAIIEGVDLDRAVAQVDLDKAVARVDLDAARSPGGPRQSGGTGRHRSGGRRGGSGPTSLQSRPRCGDRTRRPDCSRELRHHDGVDLPEIIRESTGSLSARGSARRSQPKVCRPDDAVTQFVGRLFGRDGGPST